MTRISEKDAASMGIIPATVPQHKYHAQATVVDGIRFASRKEARKYCELKLLRQAGEIVDFELQPEFELQPGYRDKHGNWVRPIVYRADFRVTYADGRVEVIDTKGHRTKDYLIKRKMLLYRYPSLNFREE